LSATELEIEYRSLARESYVRGVFLRESGDAVGALQAFQEAVRTSPQDSGLRLTLVDQLQEMGQLRQARAFLISAIERFEGTAEEHLTLARLEMWSGRNEAALTAVDRAIALDPELAEARSLQGQLLVLLGDVPGALVSFEAADTLDPDNALTQARIAECHTNIGDMDAAINAWETALNLDPEMNPARVALGELLLGAERVPEAMALYRDALDRDPSTLGPLVDQLVQFQRYDEAALLLQEQ
jgi:tetratricopeptide (TPR) repeat protein